MWINFFDTPVYIENDDVIQSVDNEELNSLTDDVIDSFIIKAQYLIDDYIWSYWTKYEENQSFIFPIRKYDNLEDLEIYDEFIPIEIKQAAVLIVENLFEISLSDDERILQEKHGDQSYTYADDWKRWQIPEQAIAILEKLKENFYIVA